MEVSHSQGPAAGFAELLDKLAVAKPPQQRGAMCPTWVSGKPGAPCCGAGDLPYPSPGPRKLVPSPSGRLRVQTQPVLPGLSTGKLVCPQRLSKKNAWRWGGRAEGKDKTSLFAFPASPAHSLPAQKHSGEDLLQMLERARHTQKTRCP